eukprot:gene17610-19364_t
MATLPESQIDSQLHIVLSKMETIVNRMQDQPMGIPLQTIKAFRTNYANVATGADIVSWFMCRYSILERSEALALGKMIANHGYIFTLPDCRLTLKDDGTYHRLQNSYYWPSSLNEITNSNYAVYLCKRHFSNKHRLQLDEFELGSFLKLQKVLQRKWELICMEAEAKNKVDKKKDKAQKRVAETQEMAFWNLHRPPPGFLNVLEADIKKIGRDDHDLGPRQTTARVSLQMASSKISEDALNHALDDAMRKVDSLQEQLHKRRIKSSLAAESLLQKTAQYAGYDPILFPPSPSNPWISDDNLFWQDINKRILPPQKQVRLWGFTLNDLLKDPQGTLVFLKFLEKEFSAENLRFWLTVEEFKFCPMSKVNKRANQIHE